MTGHLILFGKRKIRFDLVRRTRKDIRICVRPDLAVNVSAPKDSTVEKVLYKVQKRAPWIAKQIDYFQSFMPKQPQGRYISGETHYYCGRQYRLKVRKSNEQSVKLLGKYIQIYSQRTESGPRTRRLLYEWYHEKAQEMFQKLVKRCYERLKKYGIKQPTIFIRIMRLRWGSCVHSKGEIRLNVELIKTPSHCIEYVILHEMCHLKYPNHTKQFYNFLSLVLPNWRELKGRLEMIVL